MLGLRRSLGLLAVLLGGCSINNPGFTATSQTSSTSSTGSDSATVSSTGATSGSGTTSASGTTGTSGTVGTVGTVGTISTVGTTGTSDPTATNTSTTTPLTTTEGSSTSDASTGDTSTGGDPGFAPFTEKNHTNQCGKALGCFIGGNSPSHLAAIECFTVDVVPPISLDAVTMHVASPLGFAPMTVGVYALDDPAGVPLEERTLAPFDDDKDGVFTFPLPDPIIIDTPSFCVRMTTGDDATSLPIEIDETLQMSPPSYVQKSGKNGCNVPTVKPLGDLMVVDNPASTWCISVDLSSPG